jgi:hypothetical protein
MNAFPQGRQRKLLGISLYGLAALWGFNLILFPGNGAAYWLFGVGFSATMSCWCIADGRVAGRPILRSFYWLIYFLWPIAVPIYLIWARGLKGLGFALFHAFWLYGVCLAACILGGCLR